MTQAAAETAYDMVSPGTLAIEPKKTKRFAHHRLAQQPVDLREGVAKAYSVVKEVRRVRAHGPHVLWSRVPVVGGGALVTDPPGEW